VITSELSSVHFSQAWKAKWLAKILLAAMLSEKATVRLLFLVDAADKINSEI
jgi:S-adenosylmethionine synthetase